MGPALSIQGIRESFIGSNFTGEEFLSNAYHYKITFYSNNYENPDFFIGKTASISAHEHKMFHGQIDQCSITDDDQPTRKICITLVPTVYLLRHHQAYGVYLQQNVPEIIIALLKEFKIYDYDLSRLRKTYAPKAYCACFNENSFDFIRRILAEEHINFYFRHEKNKHVMVLDDTLKNISTSIKPVRTPGPVLAKVMPSNTVNKKNGIPVDFHHEYFKRNTETPGPWAPITQSWGGNDHSHFFVPENQQEVLVNFINDDPNQPVIIGTLRNDQHTPPFENTLQSGIKFSDTHQLCLNDVNDSKEFQLHSLDHLEQTIQGNSYKQIQGSSTTLLNQGNASIKAAQSYVLCAEKELKIQCGTSSIKIDQKSIQFQAELVSWK